MMFYRYKNIFREKCISCVVLLLGIIAFVVLTKLLAELHFDRLFNKALREHKPCAKVLEMIDEHLKRSSSADSFELPQSLSMQDSIEALQKINQRHTTEVQQITTTSKSIVSSTAKKIVPSVKKKKSPNGTVVFQNLIANISHSKFDNSVNYSVIYESRFLDHETPLVTSFRCAHSYHIIILITSEISHFGRREWIRKTWGRDRVSPKPRWKTFFLIGRLRDDNSMLYDLAKEIHQFNDIILINTYEGFYNLVPKLQGAFEWSSKYCDFNYLLKGDDDIFVNIVELFFFVNFEKTPKTALYGGHGYRFGWVQRKGRYGMSRDEYWRDTYPPYCSGGGFVLSKDVPPKFLKALKGVKVIRIDDAYIGELALRAEVNVHHHVGFRFMESGACNFKTDSIVHHPVKSWWCMERLYKRSEPLLTEKLKAGVF